MHKRRNMTFDEAVVVDPGAVAILSLAEMKRDPGYRLEGQPNHRASINFCQVPLVVLLVIGQYRVGSIESPPMKRILSVICQC